MNKQKNPLKHRKQHSGFQRERGGASKGKRGQIYGDRRRFAFE